MRITKKSRFAAMTAALALLLLAAMLGGCAGGAAAPEATDAPVSAAPEPTDGPVTAAPEPTDGPVTAAPEPTDAPAAETAPERQDGERYDAVIVIEGMEEAVHYEHVRNEALGFEMAYDYENFARHSEADRECFVSCWDDPEAPDNYLEVRSDPRDADTVAAAVSEALSLEYDISRDDSFPLERGGSCIRIDASAEKGGLTMPDHLQMVYIFPADDGCRIATAHYRIESAEGFGRRFHCMMDTFSVLPGQG